jgi:hypothetical protein
MKNFMLALSLTCSLAAMGETVEVTGEAAVEKGNTLAAKDKAIEDALRRAVEQALGTVVLSESLASKSVLVRDNILTKAKGYVKKYEVLSTEDKKTTYAVKVKAEVSNDQLQTDAAALGLTLARKGMPRLAVLFSEQRIDEAKPAAWWGDKAGALKLDQRVVETTLTQAWLKDGFTFVDADSLIAGVKTAKVSSTDLSANDVRELGKAVDAIDVAVVGTAVSTKSQDTAKLLDGVSQGADKVTGVTCSATLTAKAFNADNGELLAAREETAATYGQSALACGRDAMVKAAQALSKNLKDDVVAKWNAELLQGNRVQLRIEGVDSVKTFSALKTELTSRIRGAKVTGTPRLTNGVADFDVMLTASAEDAAGQLETWKVSGKTLKVTTLSPNKIEAKLSK